MKITRRHLLMLVAALPLSAWAAPYATPGQEVQTWRGEWRDDKRNRTVPVKIYHPKAGGPFPVIVFSHGLGGTRETYEYLGTYWAGHGYVAVHLQHKGSDDEVWRNGGMQAMRGAANAKNAIDRARDVSFALDQLETLNNDAVFPLHGKLEMPKVGMAGHSFGAHTTLLASGLKTPVIDSLADKRIKCAVAMSAPPPASPNYEALFGSIKIPIYHLTGTKDESPIDRPGSTAKDRRVPFDNIRGADSYLTIFKDGDHMVFSGRRGLRGDRSHDAAFHPLIQQGTLAFWDAYLKSDETAKTWLRQEFVKELAENGTFEQKIATPQP
jgi:predicted dienelactone hydrolase